jgi:hypothetical protein
MKIDELQVGMKIIPISSTHPSGRDMSQISFYMPKGFLRVCEIRPSEPTVFCWENRRHTAWGREMRMEWRWLRFMPQDLVPFTKNAEYMFKIKKALREMDGPEA